MKKFSLLVVFFILFLTVIKPAQAQNQALQTYMNANTQYAEKNYDAALSSYQIVAQLSPRFWQAFQGMGNCYYAKGDSTSALACYQKSLALNPDNLELSEFVQKFNAQMAVATPTSNFPAVGTSSPYDTAADGINRDLPRNGKFVFKIEDSDWIGSWNDLQTYYQNQITSTSTVVGSKLGVGGAYAINPYFQVGLLGQFLIKSPQVITTPGETVTYQENALGAAFEGEVTLPMDKGINFISSAQAGIYTLVGTNITASGLVAGSASFTDTAPGFMVTAGFEFVMDREKTWALDLGLDYQYLRFGSLTDTPTTPGTTVTPFTLKNSDGSNAYFDFSGVGLVLAARFF